MESPHGGRLDQEIFDAVSELIARMLRRGEELAGEFGMPGFCLKAMRSLAEPISMKELGRRMHCDPSFVTRVADALEERELVRREANPADRRIKNLVLTESGLELKARVEQALLAQAPWALTLDQAERETFLALVRKMTAAMPAAAPAP